MSEHEYTPGTEEVRNAYAESQECADWPNQQLYEAWHRNGAGEGEFDRWLAAHDAEIRKQALEEARAAAWAIEQITIEDGGDIFQTVSLDQLDVVIDALLNDNPKEGE